MACVKPQLHLTFSLTIPLTANIKNGASGEHFMVY